MKKTTIKKITLIMICVFILGAFAGCSGKNDKKTAEGTVTISVGNVPDKQVDTERYEKFRERVKKFEKKNPRIHIEENRYTFTLDSYMAKAEGGTLPTVYYLPLTETTKIMNMGYAADLTEAFEKNGFKENFNEITLSVISKDGRMYFVPESFYYVGVIVNVDLYKKAGFVAENGSLYQPKSWDDFARVAKEIKDKTGVDGFAIPTTNSMGGWRFTPIAWSYGTVFEAKNKEGKWKATFDSPECVNALKFISDLKWKYDVLPQNTLLKSNDVLEQFGAGNIAMMFGEPFIINQLTSTYKMNKDHVGAIQIPAGDKRHVSLLGGAVQVIDRNATPKQINAALKWLEYDGYTYKTDKETRAKVDDGYKTKAETNDIVGVRQKSPWKESSNYEKMHTESINKYLNVNPKNFELYNTTDGMELQLEEPFDAQALYLLLDNLLQEILTNKNADISALVKKAANNFQKSNLDFVN